MVIACQLGLSKEVSRNLIKFLEAPQQVSAQDKDKPVPAALTCTTHLYWDCWPYLMTWNSFLMCAGIMPCDFHLLCVILAFKRWLFLSHSKPFSIWYGWVSGARPVGCVGELGSISVEIFLFLPLLERTDTHRGLARGKKVTEPEVAMFPCGMHLHSP